MTMTNRIQKPLTEEMFRELITQDSWISLLAKPTECHDQHGRFKHYRTCSYPVEYIVTEEQIRTAQERQEQRKKELIEGIKPGELVFVSMGCDYPTDNPDGVGNHRIRCHFTDGHGRTLFIELCRAARTEVFYVDAVEDIHLEEQYRQDCLEVVRHNTETRRMNAHKPMPSQYYRLQVGRNEVIPGTWPAVVKFINRHFNCSYTSARKIDHFVYIDDYVCTPQTT